MTNEDPSYTLAKDIAKVYIDIANSNNRIKETISTMKENEIRKEIQMYEQQKFNLDEKLEQEKEKLDEENEQRKKEIDGRIKALNHMLKRPYPTD
ncbi:unnamed protein product [Rotaria sp. Silwood2]|nr:unnamed protein product [Rotaria sp. Silwood2]CAF3347331.1 unnamed protein product [Rotaria sp. Silwood2]CAF4516778.1 unnamed protein product [Rotaria sp. Silwood2]